MGRGERSKRWCWLIAWGTTISTVRSTYKLIQLPRRSNVSTSLRSVFYPTRACRFVSSVVGGSIATLNVIISRPTLRIGLTRFLEQIADLSHRESAQHGFHGHVANVVIKSAFAIASVANGVAVPPRLRICVVTAWYVGNCRIVFLQRRPFPFGPALWSCWYC